MKNTKNEETIKTPDGVLMRLKHRLCGALGVDIHRLKILIDRFIVRMAGGTQNTRMHYDKINTYNEVNAPKMTIKVLFKFLKILDVKRIKMGASVILVNGKEASVELDVTNTKPEQVLVLIMKALCEALGLTSENLKSLIGTYIIAGVGDVPGEDKTYHKAYTYNEINSQKMTIKDFFKFLKIIQTKQVTISLEVVTSRDATVKVTDTSVIFSQPVVEDKKDE